MNPGDIRYDPRDGSIIRRLEDERATPSAAFRGELRRRLFLEAADSPPARLRTLVAAYAGTGAVLLAFVAVSIAGIGPLAA